ncbi:DinB family protein [Streptomyces sp. NPDC002547]
MQEHDEYLYFLRRAFDGMLGAVEELGDNLGNTAPALPGANSPYAIAYHCVAVADYWLGHVVAGRPVNRDRPSEFTARGNVQRLQREVEALFARLEADLREALPSESPCNTPPAEFEGPERSLSVQGIKLHVLEELAQHHGQVQITHDLLREGNAA